MVPTSLRMPALLLLLLLAVSAAGCGDPGLTAAITSPSGDVTVYQGDELNFQATLRGGKEPYTILWTFDGAAPDSDVEDPGTIPFDTAGTYAVSLSVTDAEGTVETDSVTVSVILYQGRTRAEIVTYWSGIKPTLTTPAYATTPIFSTGNTGYEGILDTQLVSEGIAWVNFYRWLAGLPDTVTEDDTFRIRCQKGAHVLAMLAINGDSVPNPHDPPLPSGSSSYYESTVYGGAPSVATNTGGWLACASSNVFRGWGGGAYTPVQTVDGYMDDYGNDLTLGHRRWILYPQLTKTAFGLVWGSGVWASTMYVVERPGFTGQMPQFDYVCYPSQGYYPLQCFTNATALWSFSVNAAKYDLDGTTWVQVVRQSDGQDISVTTQMKTAGYGITPTLSFNTGEAAKDETYRVTVHDVWDIAGNAYFDYDYTVTFFDLTE